MVVAVAVLCISSGDIFAMTIEEVQKDPEKAMQYLVKKYKAKDWNDLVYNKQATDMDVEDVKTIKAIQQKVSDINIISSRANNLELEKQEMKADTMRTKRNKKHFR